MDRPDIPEEQVRAQVRRIATSGGFAAAESIRRLLEFTVDKAITGHGSEIKEFALGVDVFGRKESFNPQSDSIVRVQARKLRERLRNYYESEGAQDPIRIEFRTGSYVPNIRLTEAAEATARQSIAVLASAESGAGGDSDYLCDGICEALTYRLARIPTLRVAPWTMVLRARAAQKDHAQTARDLSVVTLLVVNMTVRGDTHEVHAEWLDPQRKSHLWGARYQHGLAELYCIEEEIAGDIVRWIGPRVAENPVEVSKRHTTDGRAYQLYLKGRHLWNGRTADGLKRAIQFYQLAIEQDPGYAVALAGIADAFLVLGSFAFVSPAESMPQSRAAALRALEIDGNLGEALTVLATIRALYEWDWEGAERDFQKAIALAPGYSTARHWFGMCLCVRGQFAEGQELLRSAVDLDPLSPMIGTQLASAYYLEHRFDEAIETCQSVLDIEPHFWAAEMFIGLCYIQAGRLQDALDHLTNAVRLSADNSAAAAALGYAYARAGEPVAADQVLRRLEQRGLTEYIPSFVYALICCSLGRTDAALTHLEHNLEEPVIVLPLWLVDPRFDPIREEERFQVLLRRVGLR